jgi:S-disulfanyl-L-cysteine oxidoreductase SoxD
MKRTAFAAGAALSFFIAGCRVSPPGKWETSTLTRIKHSVTVGGKSVENPLSASPETITSGKDAFSHYCVACHGLDGQNTGVPFADRMSPPVPSLKSATVQSYTDGQLKWIIDNGISPSGMPASKGTLTDDEIWSIVIYLRHLPEAGSLGEPQMYSGDDSPSPGVTKTNHKR